MQTLIVIMGDKLGKYIDTQEDLQDVLIRESLMKGFGKAPVHGRLVPTPATAFATETAGTAFAIETAFCEAAPQPNVITYKEFIAAKKSKSHMAHVAHPFVKTSHQMINHYRGVLFNPRLQEAESVAKRKRHLEVIVPTGVLRGRDSPLARTST
jgi:hypothetical protein